MANPWDNDPIVDAGPQAAAQPQAQAPMPVQGAPAAAPVAAAVQPAAAAPAAPAQGGNPWDNDPIVSPAPAAAPQDTSFVGQLEHQGGLLVRGAVQAAAALPGAVSDAVTAPINAGLDLAMGKGNGFRFQHVGDALGNVMDQAGVAQPQSASERVVQGAMQGVGNAAGGVGLGMAIERAATGPFTAAIGKMLQHAPLMQLASGATGGGAQQVAQEAGAGPLTQAAAGIAGAVAPSLVPFGAAAGVRGLVRGGEDGAQQMQRNIDTFQGAAGTTPTLGQATQNPVVQALETGSANTILGDGIMQRAGRRQLDAMDGTINDLVSQLAPNAAPEDAGDAISRGIQSFKDSFRSQQKNLYGKLDQLVAPNAPVRVDATKQVMADLNADITGAPALSKWFKNAKIQGLQQALESDTSGAPASVHVYRQPPAAGGGLMNAPVPRDPLQVVIPEGPPTNTLPYEAVAKLRTLVGQELTNNSLTSDIPRSKWSALYAALSDDLGTAAAGAGPQAQQAWQRANDFTRAGLARLDRLDSVVSKDLPESIYKTAMGSTGDGGTRIRTVMKSLPAPEKRQVIATTLQDLGRAGAGSQNAAGDRFSSDVFLTNYNKLSTEARQALFNSSAYPGLGAKLDALANMASIRKDSGKVFANPSGSGRFVVAAAQLADLLQAVKSGSPGSIATSLAAISIPAGFAKVASSPLAVKWFAQPTQLSGAAAPAAVEAAVHGVSAEQQPAPYADGGSVQPTSETFKVYPAAARARRSAGIDAEIVRTADGFVVRPKAAQAEAAQMQNPFASYADGGQVQPAAPAPAADIDAKAHEAASSPLNDRPEPTPAQAQAGNYRKGHVNVQGMQISIENPAGSTRRGVDPDGTPWESTLTQHYGYVKGSKGADGDHLDVFVGPTPASKTVHVIDQLKPDGSFDEHKAMVGYPNEYAARSAYLSNYPPGQESRIGAMTALPVPAFKAWATSGKLKEPLAYEAPGAASNS